MGRIFTLLFSAFTLVAATVQAQPSDYLTIRGEVFYPQRIALPPNSVARVRLSDVSLADAAAPIVAEQVFENRQVPIPFEIRVTREDLKSNHRYSLGGSIHDAMGRLLWTTDTIIPINPDQDLADVGRVMLVPVGTAQTETAITGGEWRVEDIDSRGVLDFAQTTIEFSPDGQVSGSGGCNRFHGTYEWTGDTLTLGALATTRRACPEALMAQEDAFFRVLAGPLAVSFSDTGAIVLTNESGETLLARR